MGNYKIRPTGSSVYEPEAEGSGSDDTSKLAVAIYRFSAEGPRVRVFVVVFEDELEKFLFNSDILLPEKSFFPNEIFVEFDAVFSSAFVRRRTEETKV